MSPSVSRSEEHHRYQRPGLFIHGIGVQYPPYLTKPAELETFARRFYPSSPAYVVSLWSGRPANFQSLEKVLSINRYTGIETRSTFATIDYPLANLPEPPSIAQLSDIFLEHGVKLSVEACSKAIASWGGPLSDITHIVAVTCTNSANPGFDLHVVNQLGLSPSIERVLLHGVGCSGGLAALRTASNIAHGASYRGKPARILVLACEISTMMVRSELESIVKLQETRIGLALFSDCASAVVLGNDIETSVMEEPMLELLGWDHRVIEDSQHDLGFDVDPLGIRFPFSQKRMLTSLGWKVILSPRVPKLAAAAVPAMFKDLVGSIPELNDSGCINASDFDWALHPGGATILTGVESAMGLTTEHLRASYEIYMNHGNSSSATVFAVLDRLMRNGGRSEYVTSCAFGPGIATEMVMMKKLSTSPPGTDSPGTELSDSSSSQVTNGVGSIVIADVD